MEEEILEEQPKEENSAGSSFGKFSNVEDLKQAYQNLEKEFTRKSQLLKKYQEKENEKNDAEVSKIQQEIETDKKSCFEKDNWQKCVQEFFEKSPLASEHKKEIAQIVVEDKELQKSDSPLIFAWAKWLEKNFKTQEQLLEDSSFLESVKTNEKIKKAIIDDYLKDLNSRETIPPIFLKSSLGGVVKQKQNKTQTLEDVKELAKKIFNK